MNQNVQEVTLIGFGAIGRSIFQHLKDSTDVRITNIVVSSSKILTLQEELGQSVQVCDRVPEDSTLVVECAGHSALTQHVIPALALGIECAILSVGALCDDGLVQKMADSAEKGRTRVHLLSGAIGGIDAIAAARISGLTDVTYTGRKPPSGWRSSHAETLVDLDKLDEATIILKSSAREAARLYPKNANVAATISLAGVGLDKTQVVLIADPNVTENIHEIVARGQFGEMHLKMHGKPLPNNPKTSALTVLSALRFLQNRSAKLIL
jgi:aspartate dehydrogenase